MERAGGRGRCLDPQEPIAGLYSHGKKIKKNRSGLMGCKFRWVHLSDIHYQMNGSGFNSSRLKEKLLEYLQDQVKAADALIITGDFRYAPEGDTDAADVCKYIAELQEALGGDTARVVTVPGNHDLTRSAIRSAVIMKQQKDYSPEFGKFDSDYLAELTSGFSYFRNIQDELGNSDYGKGGLPHTLVKLDNCNLLLLNTAMLAGKEKDQDKGSLLLGVDYLHEVLPDEKKRAKPIIAVGHHGWEYLEEQERNLCAKYLDQVGVRLYLCGHSHKIGFTSFGTKGGMQVNAGCLMQNDKTATAGFFVGELDSDGTVQLSGHEWDTREQRWGVHGAWEQNFEKLYRDSVNTIGETAGKPVVIKKETKFTLIGYRLLAERGEDGIKYFWKKGNRQVESLALNTRLKHIKNLHIDDTDVENVSAYTTPVSFGCQLAASNQHCRFCQTGAHGYQGPLLAEEIALQNIFMAKYDSNCPNFPEVHSHKREFAFMGQGEPALHYPAVRRSIQLTDRAMELIGQEVHRYIISTCGIEDFFPELIRDINSGFFKNRVTLHFSLHAIGAERDALMPINRDFNYKRFLENCRVFYDTTHEKIGVGIMMLKGYRIKKEHRFGSSSLGPFSLTPEKLSEILKELDPGIFRIDLCDLNQTSLGSQSPLRNVDSLKLCKVLEATDFEWKIFSSFGSNEQSGCGMLESLKDGMTEEMSDQTIQNFNDAVDILEDVKAQTDRL